MLIFGICTVVFGLPAWALAECIGDYYFRTACS